MPTLINTGQPNNYMGEYRVRAPMSSYSTPELSEEQYHAIQQRVFNRVSGENAGMGAWEKVSRASYGIVLDTADSIWSTPLNPFGNRGDVWSLASGEQQEYMERNKGLIETGSAITGGVLTAVAAEALLVPRLAAALGSSTALTGTAAWRAASAWNQTSKVAMMAGQRAAAEAGVSYALTSTKTGLSYLANRAVAGAAATLRTVPIEYAVMWNNEAFNSKDAATEGFWIGAAGVLGGTVGSIGAKWTSRMIANSEEIRDLRSQSLALAGTTNDLLSDDYLDLVSRRTDLNKIQLKESARTTDFLVRSRTNNFQGMDTPTAIASRSDKLRDIYGGFAVDSIQKWMNSGISGIATQKTRVKDSPEIMHIIDTVSKEDPFIFHGMAEAGVPNMPLQQAREARGAYIESLRKQADVANKQGNQKEAMRLNVLQRQLRMQEDALLVNGSWQDSTSKFAEAVVEFDPQKTRAQLMRYGPDKESFKITVPGADGKISLDAALTPMNASGAPIAMEKVGHKTRLATIEIAADLVKRLSLPSAKTKFKLTDKAATSWFSLDLAADIIDNGGSIDFAMKTNKLMNVDDIRRESLRIKANTLLDEVGPDGRITDEHRFRYNLPLSTAMERLEDDAGDTLRQWLIAAADDKGTIREMATALQDSRIIQGIDLKAPSQNPLPRTDGDMLRFNRDKKGNWLKPILGYFDQKSQIARLSQQGHHEAMTLRKAITTRTLVDDQGMVGQHARDLVAMPELVRAMDVASLHADQSTGLGNPITQAIGEVLPGRFKERDNIVTLSASKLQEISERRGLDDYAALMESVEMQKVVTQITSSGHAHQQAMLDQYFSLAGGWDIESVVPHGGGNYGFMLRDSASNRHRLGLSETDEWEDAWLTNPQTNKEILVDDFVRQVIENYGKVTDTVWVGDNTINRAKGTPEVEYRKNFVPSPDTRGALIGFVFDPADKQVPGRTIVARNQAEYDQLYKKTIEDLGADNGYTIRSKEQLESLRTIDDRVNMDWMNPGVSVSTAGIGSQKGGLTGAYVRQGAFQDALEWVKRKIIAQRQDTLRTLMAEPLLVARARSAAEQVVSPTGGKFGGRNIFDVYEQMLTGKSGRFAETSIVDKGIKAVEKQIDSVLASSAIAAPARYITDLASRIGMNPRDLSGKRTYAEIAKAMGEHTPFANAMEYMASRGIAPPPTVRGMSTKLNSLAATVLLRWLDLPHAAMNIVGLVNTIPPVLFGGRAPVSTFIKVKGKDMAMIDSAKIIADSMKDMFSRTKTADWKYMERMGYAKQSVMEYHTNLAAVDSQAGFMKWAKHIDKWLSAATDSSENWSRQMAHFVGLRMADYQGIKGMAARHEYAAEIANSVIADYAPINRPELFGSGFGSMFGLFQSYGLNQFTKMFRWMERGQFKMAGMQAAIQASMFGLPGTYGVGALFDFRDSVLADSGEPTMLDMIYERFGSTLGGAIAHGSISQVTQLALWTRGDMSPRIPGMSGTLPAIDVGMRVLSGFKDAVTSYANAMPGAGGQAVLEVAQREMPNRIMKSWLTLANGGREIDAYGNVMAETQGLMDIASRMIGLRSSRQQSELEAFYEGKGAMERDAIRMEKLRHSFKSAARAHGGDISKVDPMGYFNDYVKAGGNPARFKSWVKSLMRDATSPRAVRDLQKSLVTPEAALSAWRYGAYGAATIRNTGAANIE